MEQNSSQARRFRKRRMSEINVVPYIDVMLVLLVIFMITAPLLTEGVKVELPETSARPLPDEQQEPVVVSVDAKGQYYLNLGDNPDKPLDDSTLVKRVQTVMRHRSDESIYIRGDKAASYGQVVGVMALLQSAGVNKVGLVTQPADK